MRGERRLRGVRCASLGMFPIFPQEKIRVIYIKYRRDLRALCPCAKTMEGRQLEFLSASDPPPSREDGCFGGDYKAFRSLPLSACPWCR